MTYLIIGLCAGLIVGALFGTAIAALTLVGVAQEALDD